MNSAMKNDTVYRKAVIDAMCNACSDWCDEGVCKKVSVIQQLPSTQSKPQWIPCSEQMPKDDTEVIVSCTDDSGDSEFSYTTTGWHFNGLWVVGNERSCFVRAWMPLPEPHQESRV